MRAGMAMSWAWIGAVVGLAWNPLAFTAHVPSGAVSRYACQRDLGSGLNRELPVLPLLAHQPSQIDQSDRPTSASARSDT